MRIDFLFTKELLLLDSIFNRGEDNLRIVGGAVRNYLLGKEINDYDLSCKFTPDETLKILEKNHIKHIELGIKFGTVIAIINDKQFEITATREDVKTDGRHAIVKYTSDFEVDSGRRDFTFNALYLDFKGNIYDYHNGILDLKKGIVRFIGDPETRIKEDYLRILRFFRFYCQYGAFLDNEGLKYAILLKDNLLSLSSERIRAEMMKILNADYSVKTLKIMERYNILQLITNIHNFNYKNLEIFYSLKKFLNIAVEPSLALALFIQTKSDLDVLREKWKLSNKENKEVLKLLEYGNRTLNLKEILFYENNKTFAINLLIYNSILNCDKISGNLLNYINEKIAFIRETKIPVFPITGIDLDKMGIFSKKEYGKILTSGKELFIKSNFTLQKDDLLEILRDNYS